MKMVKPWAYQFLSNCVCAYDVRDSDYAIQLKDDLTYGKAVQALERIGKYIRTGK